MRGDTCYRCLLIGHKSCSRERNELESILYYTSIKRILNSDYAIGFPRRWCQREVYNFLMVGFPRKVFGRRSVGQSTQLAKLLSHGMGAHVHSM